MNHQVYVISADRYLSLNFNDKQKKHYIFCVKQGQKKLYQNNGCVNVFETGNLMQSRNWALNHAFENNKMCIQLSDDLKKVRTNKSFLQEKKVESDSAIEEVAEMFKKTSGIYLLGIPPTDNHFFAAKKIVKNAFCIGDLLFVKPSKPRFDDRLSLKEDYDFTLEHIKTYGICIRYQKYLWTFEHYSNAGGAVAYRTESKEQQNIEYLRNKWGNKIKLNPKRKNEILL
jgi:hypothetical protein